MVVKLQITKTKIVGILEWSDEKKNPNFFIFNTAYEDI